MYSDEQRLIVDKLIDEKYNVRVKAVAGSGKTTTIKHILERTKEDILVLMYNKELADESRKKLLNGNNSNNIKISTIHSLAQKLYEQICKTDDGLDEILEKKLPIKNKVKFKYLIIDEAQDLTPLMIDIINKIIEDHNIYDLRLCILGDQKQCIYQFCGSDEKYLIEPKKYIHIKGDLIDCSLATTYRLTKEMTEFINKCIINEKEFQMISTKKGTKPVYRKTNIYAKEHYEDIYNIIKEKKDQGYQYSDIAIIAYSLKKQYIKNLLNYLSDKKIPIHISDDDYKDDSKDNKINSGKLYFSTIHKMKGRQRKIIIYYGFDTNKCTNIMYVALTRAEEELICIQDNQNENFKLLNNFDNYVDYIKDDYTSNKDDKNDKNDNKNKTIFNLIKDMDSKKINYYNSLLNIELLNESESDIIKNTKIKFNSGYEDVLDIYNTSIIFYLRYIRDNNYLNNFENDTRYNKSSIKEPEIKNIYQDIAYNSNKKNYVKSGYKHLLNQIDNYDWLDENIIEKATSRCTLLPKKGYFEKEISYTINDIYIHDYIDFISNDKKQPIWVLKFTSELEPIHILQVALYIALYYKVHNELRPARLFNIRTKEIYSINLSKNICEFLLFDISYKYTGNPNKIDFDKTIEDKLNKDETYQELLHILYLNNFKKIKLINHSKKEFFEISLNKDDLKFLYYLDRFRKIKSIEHSKENFFNILINKEFSKYSDDYYIYDLLLSYINPNEEEVNNYNVN